MSDRLIRKIQTLWQTPSFSASFSGVNAVQRALKLEKNISVPISVIVEALKGIPEYLQHLAIKSYRFNHRNFDQVCSYGQVFQVNKLLCLNFNEFKSL
jgi:hypothetical protein